MMSALDDFASILTSLNEAAARIEKLQAERDEALREIEELKLDLDSALRFIRKEKA